MRLTVSTRLGVEVENERIDYHFLVEYSENDECLIGGHTHRDHWKTDYKYSGFLLPDLDSSTELTFPVDFPEIFRDEDFTKEMSDSFLFLGVKMSVFNFREGSLFQTDTEEKVFSLRPDSPFTPVVSSTSVDMTVTEVNNGDFQVRSILDFHCWYLHRH